MLVNHIYKVVWSKTKGCYIVVSELAKRVGRNKMKAIVIGSSAMAMVVSPMMVNTVGANLNQAGTGQNDSVAWGSASNAGWQGVAVGSTTTTSGTGAVAVGNSSQAIKNNAVAVGKKAEATEDSSIAVGLSAKASGSLSEAIGVETISSGARSIAIGYRGKAEGEDAISIGKNAQSTKNSSIALGQGAQATGERSSALSMGATASGNDAVAISRKSNSSGSSAVAIGESSIASGNNSVALGQNAKATATNAVAILNSSNAGGERSISIGQNSNTSGVDAIALGTNSKSTHVYTIALGRNTQASGQRSMAFGNEAKATANDTIAFGSSSEAKKDNDIIIGKEAKSRDEGNGNSIAIGYGATAGSNRIGYSADGGNNAGGVAIGIGSFTGLNRTNTAINSSVAVGAGAGAGYRMVGTDGLPTGNATDADDNDTVLVKAFGGTKSTLDYFKNTGKANAEGFFSFQNVDINEGTALGRNTRAIGDQSVAIGAQSVAGQGSIVIGGNDIQAYDRKNYFKAKNPDSGDAKGVNDFNAETTPGTGKNGQPITITNKYRELVGAALDNSYRASYGQDGSTVIGMQAHSTTPLGVAIGTNAIVRKGAFGATAIGSGASVVANAEAAVAIGMGSEAQGNYAVAAGTAARAKESAVAAGYSANAEINAVAVGNKSVSKASAVAVGDESEATNSSVAVGQSAKAQKVADIAVGQGAVASGEQGAIAVGLGTQAQGDSSIMIGGSEVTKVAAQFVNYQKEKKDAQGRAVIKSTKKIETIGGEQIERTIRSVEMENTSGTIQQAYGELTNGDSLNTATLDYSSAANRNGHGSISMGVHSLSTGDLGTAIGTGARVTKLGGVALGTGAISELQNGVAIGTGSRADLNSIGTRQTDISYDNEGKIVPFDSKKVAYTFYWAGGTNTSEGDVVSFGSPGAERQLKNVAAGRIADDSTDAINGSQLNSVTKRMSSGWAVEAEKDNGSSGMLKLNGVAATAGTETFTADGKSSSRENPGTATGHIDKVRLNDEVKIRVGDNLVLHQEEASRPVYEDPDNPTRQTGTRVTSKFTYSLNPELMGLKNAQFKNDAGDTTDINGAGVTVTPVTAGKQPVSLTTTGLNNGGNAISNVAGNLPETKNNDAATGVSNATTSQAAPTLGNADSQVNLTNAATVSDVLNAGWNLQGDGTAVDFVKPYDTVNFVKGDGTSVTVESKDGKTATVKYSVNLGNGLEKDANNTINVKAADKSLTVGTDGVKVNPGDKSLKTTDAGLTVNTADKSLEVTNDGLKVKAGDNTLTTDTNGLKVNTGEIESVTTGSNSGTVKVKDGDTGKVATVDSVVNAVNSAAWTATSAATSAGELGATPTNQSVKAGDKVIFEADKNIKITQAGSKFTFATRDDVSFNTVQVGGSTGPKLNKSDAGDLKVSGPNGTDPVKVTNVKDGDVSADSKDAINGSQFHKLANNTIQLKGQTGDNTATETNKQALNKENGLAFTIKSSDGTLLEVSAADDTITLKPKTATLKTGADGVPTADTTNGKLVTADQLVNTLTEMGWKATADKDGSGTVSGAATELIKAGNTVTFKAGDNLSVKQNGKNFIYSLQKELTGLTSAEFKNQASDKTVINSDGVTITPVTNGKQPVSLTKDGLNNGGNPITNVTSNLVNYTDPEVNGVQMAKNSLRNLDNNSVANTNAATVGDLRNMGWVVSSDKTTGANGTTTATEYSEAVKNANEVRFVGEGSAIVSGKTEGNVRTITLKVDNQTGINKTVTPVNYTKADGTKVYPQEVDNGDGTKTVKFFENPGGTGKEIPSTEVITSVNGPKGTTTPTILSNIKSNLPDTKNSDTANTADVPSNATKSQGAPNTTDKAGNTYVNPNNAATVSDVLNVGWNLQGNGTEVDFVKAYDTVNFIDGDGTTATVASADGKISTVKYSVNLGDGLEKDTNNTIIVKSADKSLEVTADGVKVKKADESLEVTNDGLKVKADGTTITIGNNGLQVNTGIINNITTGDKSGTVEANNGDENKVATVGNVVNAINNVAWTATSAKTNDGELGKEATDQLVKSGDKVTFEADKNIKITQDGSKFTFATKNDVSFDTVQVGGDQGPKLSKTDDGDLKVSGSNGTSPVKVTNVTSGLDKYGDQVNGADVLGTNDKNRGLVDLSKPENGQPKVSDNTAATVGDLRNMGWIVSADKKTDDLTTAYSDTVKNANEVKFVGAGTAIVSGNTVDGVRTITVKVDDQTSMNNAVTPVVYTDQDGNQVYPTGKKDKDGNQIFNKKPDGTGEEVTGPVKTTINGPKGTTSPTSLSNVKNNIPNVNDGSKTITDADGNEKPAPGDVENIKKAPLTAEEAAALANPKTKDGQTNPKYIGNNAATVSDVLNAGWNLQNNGESRDFVKPYDTVNFVNGLGTTAVVTTREGNTASDVTFNVKAANGSVTVDENGVKVTTGEIKPAVGTDNKETGAIATPADPATAKQLKETLAAAEKDLSAAREALKEAEKALAADPKDPALQKAVADKKADVAAKQTPVDAAQKAHDEAGLNKVATVQNVAEAINNSGFNLKTSADGGEKLTTGSENDGELIKPSNTVEMVAGKNLTVKQDTRGKITYATKDDVKFTNVDTGTLNVGSPNTYTDGKGNTYTKVGENYYKPADVENGVPKQGATPVDVTTTPVTPVSPVTMKAEAAKPATNNATDAQPSSALNVTSKDGKPTQITGVASTLNTKTVDTTPAGTAPGTTPNPTQINLVDLEGTNDAPVNKNAAATVGDLQNMGWVVSTKDGNGYKDVVKNANVVDFKGDQGVTVTGKTLADGTREITVGIKEGEVTNKVTITHGDGSKIDAVKIGDNYYKVDKDGKPVGFEKGPDGKPAGTPLNVDPNTDKVTNAGAGFVTGNTVANAIQDSGWNVGIGSTDKDFSKDAKVYDKVNPNDDVKFSNGANTNVSMVTVDALNEDGTKKATTYVKVDINRDLKIDSVTTGGTATDKNGNNLVKVGDQYYKEGDVTIVTNPDGTTTVTPKENAKAVPPADVIPPKDGAMIVKNADGKDVVSATVGKDGNGAFGINGKDGKNGISMTAKDGQGTIGVNGKDGKSTTIAGDTITIKDKDNKNSTEIGINSVTLKDKDGNTNTSTAAGTIYTDKDKNTTTVGPKEIVLKDEAGNNASKLTNKELLLNAKDPKTGVETTSHMSGDKIAFNTTDEIEKDPVTHKPVIDPKTNQTKIKTPGNSTEYTNEGLKVIPNDTVARDAKGNLTFLDKDGKPVMKDTDGKYKYMGQDGQPGKEYIGGSGSLKPNVVDNTRVISFGMDKPVYDQNGKQIGVTEGISAGMQQIHNVAPGTKNTDAVNVSQLKGIAGNVVNISNRMNRMGAQAAALASLQSIQYDPLEPTQISAGLGYYKGSSALALGVNHFKNESTMFHMGASLNGHGDETMVNASVTWKFGDRADETAVKDTFRQGPISASYTLQDKVSALEAQTRVQKEQLKTINGLEKQVEMLKALNEKQQEQIAELFKRLTEMR